MKWEEKINVAMNLILLIPFVTSVGGLTFQLSQHLVLA